MRGITINNTRYTVPETWDELSTKALEFLAEMYLLGTSPQEIKVKLLIYCLNGFISERKGNILLVIKKQQYVISPEDMTFMASCFDFLFLVDPETGELMLDPAITKNPFPFLSGKGWTRLKGPAAALTDIRYEQFIYLQTYASAYANAMNQQLTTTEESLNMLIASLYHSGDAFDASKMKIVAGQVSKVSPAVRIVVYWFYLGCMRFIAEKFPKVFERDESGHLRNMFDVQMRMVDILADGDVTKKDNVRRSLLYDVLYTFEGNVERAENIKQ